MSVSIDPKKGVRVHTVRKPGWGIAALIIVLESIFSVFLYMSLAERIFVVIPAAAQPGVPPLIAYQGLLTDTSGNPLGGAGSVYCFRYSIWDNPTVGSGNQLWPLPSLGDASTTPSNSTTTVTDGVFSDELGRTDTITALDFESTSTYYLQVQVSTSSQTCASQVETLSPRQQIVSDAWSQTTQNVYGNQLRTFSSNNTVQIGTAGGQTAGSQTLLSLDVVNVTSSESIGGSCTQNGTLWYDSTLKVALACANMIIQPITNGTSTVNSIGTNGTSSLISSGEAYFSASANITISQKGNTISFSVAAPAAGATLGGVEPYPLLQSGSTGFAPGAASWYFQPFVAPQAIGSGRLDILVSNSNSSSGLLQLTGNGASFRSASTGTVSINYTQGHSAALYSIGAGANSTQLASMWSSAWTVGIAESISVTSSNNTAATQTNLYASASVTISYIQHIDASGNVTTNSWTTGGNTSTVSANMATNVFTSIFSSGQNLLSGQFVMPIPFNTSIPAGQYWMAMAYNSTSTSGGTSLPDVMPFVSQYGLYGGSQQLFRLFNQTITNSSSAIFPGFGVYSAASATAPAVVQFTQIRSVALDPIQYFNIVNQSF